MSAPAAAASAAAAAAAAAARSNVPVLIGLMLGILLAALDQAVVGTSLAKIVADVGGFERFTWLFSAYMLASTVVIPVAGKLSDLYGRRPVYLVGMGVFLLGSMLCGTATSMTQLILYRAVQGLGGGAIFPVALATIADLYPPSERGRVGGLFAAMFGISSVIGPFAGGWIVDNLHLFGIASWRWVFYVNLPVGLVAIAMVSAFFPRTLTTRRASIDYAGIGLLTLGLLALLLLTVWGGDTYAWTSPQIAGLVLTAAVAFAAFAAVERRAQDPVIPLALFRNPVFVVCAIAGVLGSAAMFTAISFMPTYLQGVVGISATAAGGVLVPLSMGIVLGSIGSGALMKRYGYKPFMMGGFGMAAAGFVLLSRASAHLPLWVTLAQLAFLGLGLGFTIQTVIVGAQNAIERRHMGAATSSITLFRSLGATLGVTAMGTLLNRRLATEIPANVEPTWVARMLDDPFIGGRIDRVPSLLLQPDAVAAISQAPGGEAALAGLRFAFSTSVHAIFLMAAGVAMAALVVTLALRSLPMKTAEEHAAQASTDPAAP